MFCTRYFPDRYFAPRYFPKVGAVYVPPVVTDVNEGSFFQAPAEHMTRHHFPKSSSHIGARHHHGFVLFPGLRPAGA